MSIFGKLSLKVLGKRGLSFTCRAFSQLLGRKKKDDGRSKDALKKLWSSDGATKMFQISSVTYATKSHSDPCGGDPKLTDCHIDLTTLIRPCEQIKIPSWKGPCDKICLPCCRPINTPVRCDRPILRMNLCSGVEYKYPSFAETVEYIDCGVTKTDCCHPPKCTEIYPIGFLRRHAPFKEFQKTKLGVPHGSRRFFSTIVRYCDPASSSRLFSTISRLSEPGKRFFNTSARLSGKKCDPEDKPGKPGEKKKLKCLNPVPSTMKELKRGPQIRECEKMCTPCCKPCREPPYCEFPYQKPPCQKLKTPRKSYSDCQAEKVQKKKPCECQFVPPKKLHVITKGGKADKK